MARPAARAGTRAGTMLESSAAVRVDQVIRRALALALLLSPLTMPLTLLTGRVQGFLPCACALSYGLLSAVHICLLLGSTTGDALYVRRHRSIDRSAACLYAVAGWLLETALPSDLVVGMVNLGFLALCGSLYVCALRLSVPGGLPLLVACLGGHWFATAQNPMAFWQGLALEVLIFFGARLVANEVRQAGAAERAAFDELRRAEKMEAAARIHDGRGLLSAVGKFPAKDLTLAARAMRARTASWQHKDDQHASIEASVAEAVQQFPDLPVVVELSSLGGFRPQLRLAAAVGTAVHTLLTNVRMHAGAHSVVVTVGKVGRLWQVSVVDDGCGFPAGDGFRGRAGGGIETIAQAVLEMEGATLTVRSTPGVGTTAVICGPRSEVAEPVNASATRFSSWRRRPAGGQARAAFISDVAQFVVLTLPVMSLMTSIADLRNQQEDAVATAGLNLAGTAALVALWFRGPRPPAWLAIGLTVVASTAGTVVATWNHGRIFAGDKTAVTVLVCAGIMLAAAAPRIWGVAALLALPPLAVLLWFEPLSALSLAGQSVIASTIAGQVIGALVEFTEATAGEKKELVELERRRAGATLHQLLCQIDTAPISDSLPTAPPKRPEQGS